MKKIIWKLYFTNDSVVESDTFFKVFNSWIPNSPEVFVDVADYSHVHDGPLTVLVGHYVDYMLDDSDRRKGFLYSRKLGLHGSVQENLKQSLKEILKASQRLKADPEFKGQIHFIPTEFLFMINDRADAPNTSQTFQNIQPHLTKLFNTLFGPNQYTLTYHSDPKKRFTVTIKTPQSKEIKELLDLIRK